MCHFRCDATAKYNRLTSQLDKLGQDIHHSRFGLSVRREEIRINKKFFEDFFLPLFANQIALMIFMFSNGWFDIDFCCLFHSQSLELVIVFVLPVFFARSQTEH